MVHGARQSDDLCPETLTKQCLEVQRSGYCNNMFSSTCISTIRIDRFELIQGSSSGPDRANRKRLTLFLMIDMDFVQTIKNGQTKCEAENLVLAWQNPQLQAYPIRTRPSLPLKVTVVS